MAVTVRTAVALNALPEPEKLMLPVPLPTVVVAPAWLVWMVKLPEESAAIVAAEMLAPEDCKLMLPLLEPAKPKLNMSVEVESVNDRILPSPLEILKVPADGMAIVKLVVEVEIIPPLVKDKTPFTLKFC